MIWFTVYMLTQDVFIKLRAASVKSSQLHAACPKFVHLSRVDLINKNG